MSSKFNWHSDEIKLSTQIDKNYKLSQNVRRFFNAQLGREIHFDRTFMAWMKANVGKTMEQALKEFESK